MDVRAIISKLNEIEESPAVGDTVYLEFGDILEVETTILEVTGEGMVLEADDKLVGLLEDLNKIEESGLQYYTGKKKYGKEGMAALAAAGRKGASQEELGRIKDKHLKKEELEIDEAEYQGRNVSLGKPMQGDVKKFKVYVRDPKTGNVKKVNFGDKKMRIKKSNPARRKSFRARHNCANPGPRTKARYWSCRKW